jgi:MFS family permease
MQHALDGFMQKRAFQFRLLFLCASHTLLHVYTNLPLALLPILINEYALSIFLASIIISIPRALSLVFSIPSGLLADRFGHNRLISFGLFSEVLGASLIFLFPNAEMTVLGFSLISLGSTFYHPPALSATSNISPSDFLTRGLGFHGASGTFGISLGPITLGFILNWLGWRYAYLIWIVPIFFIAIVAFFINFDCYSYDDYNERKKKRLTTPLTDVLSATFLSFLLLMFFQSAAGGTISTYLTTYLTGSKGLDAALASIVFGLSPLIGLTSVIIGGYAGDKFGWRRSLTLIISTVAIVLLLMFTSTSAEQTVLFYLIYGFFSIMTMPITSSLVARIIPQKSRGTAYSLQFVPESIVGIIIPIILGILINFFEIWIIFPIAIVFFIIALLVAQILKFKE